MIDSGDENYRVVVSSAREGGRVIPAKTMPRSDKNELMKTFKRYTCAAYLLPEQHYDCTVIEI